MKQGSNSRRTRGRGGNGKRSSNRNNNYDNGGPEGRIRGNANQIHEKYMALARDALATDDRISSENYFQHAEHFYRIMMEKAESKKDASNNNNDQSPESSKERGKSRRARANNRTKQRHHAQNNDTNGEEGKETSEQTSVQKEKNKKTSPNDNETLAVLDPENESHDSDNIGDKEPDENVSI